MTEYDGTGQRVTSGSPSHKWTQFVPISVKSYFFFVCISKYLQILCRLHILYPWIALHWNSCDDEWNHKSRSLGMWRQIRQWIERESQLDSPFSQSCQIHKSRAAKGWRQSWAAAGMDGSHNGAWKWIPSITSLNRNFSWNLVHS